MAEWLEYGPVYDDGTPMETRRKRVEDGRGSDYAFAVVQIALDGRAWVLKWAWHDRSARAWMAAERRRRSREGFPGGRMEMRPVVEIARTPIKARASR